VAIRSKYGSDPYLTFCYFTYIICLASKYAPAPYSSTINPRSKRFGGLIISKRHFYAPTRIRSFPRRTDTLLPHGFFIFLIFRLVFQHEFVLHQLQDCSILCRESRRTDAAYHSTAVSETMYGVAHARFCSGLIDCESPSAPHLCVITALRGVVTPPCSTASVTFVHGLRSQD
jgi:hypothetical protein